MVHFQLCGLIKVKGAPKRLSKVMLQQILEVQDEALSPGAG